MMLSRALLLGSVALAPAMATAALSPDQYLPENSTLIVASEPIPQLVKNFEASPLHEFVSNDSIAALYAPLMEKLSDKGGADSFAKAFGMAPDELGEIFDGPIVIGLDLTPTIASVSVDSDEPKEPTVFLATKLGDKEKFDEILQSDALRKSSAGDAEVSEEEFMGVAYTKVSLPQADKMPAPTWDSDTQSLEDPVAGEPQPPIVYFYSILDDDTLLLTTDEKALEDAIVVSQSGDSAFASKPLAMQYQDAVEDGVSVYMGINFSPIADLFEKMIRVSEAKQSKPNMMMPSAQGIIDTLDLHSLHDLSVSFYLEEDVVRGKSVLHADTGSGVGKIVALNGTEYPNPKFVPASAIAADSYDFDVGGFFDLVEQMFASAAPMPYAMYQGYLQQIQQQTQVNVRQDLLGNFGEGIISFNVEAPQGTTVAGQPYAQVLAIRVKNSKAFARALDMILQATPIAGAMEHRDFNGTDLRVFTNSITGQTSGAVAVTDDWMLFSSQLFALQNALSSSERSLWDSTSFQSLSKRLPQQGNMLSYMKLSSMLKMQLHQILATPLGFESDADDGLKELLEAAKNIEDLPFYLIGTSYMDDDGSYRSESFLLKQD